MSWDWEDCERRRKVYDYYNTPLDGTLIARGRAGCQQGAGPASPT